jgi:gas vesicle protein
MKARFLGGGIGFAAVVLLAALGSASADQWFVLGEKVVKSMDPNAEIKAEEGKMWKEDIKKTKITVEGADVEITKVVLRWKGRKDDTITKVGVVKSGGATAEKDAPGREATLTSVAVQYKILDNKPTATLKVWGYD